MHITLARFEELAVYCASKALECDAKSNGLARTKLDKEYLRGKKAVYEELRDMITNRELRLENGNEGC